jgi:peptide/nickel transport system ATP-binding protein
MEKGETLGLVGESGSGKSTLGFALIRLLPSPGVVAGGGITFEGQNLLRLNEKRMQSLRGNRIAFVFQNPMTSLNPVKTVESHFVELLRTHKPQMSQNEASERARALLDELGIPAERVQDYPHQFSGGMRQRIMIGLAIALNPSLAIADEPTTALDVIVQDRILDILKDLSQKHEMALVLITHDLSIVLERCDNVFVMYAGHQVEYGKNEQIYRSPKHPYTQGLLNSIPNIGLDYQKLTAIPGSPPDLLNMPSGCPFSPRCPYAMPVCKMQVPPLFSLEIGHLVRCFLYGGTAD